MKSLLLVALFGVLVSATIHFQEDFDDKGWESRWVKSQNKEKEGTQGKWGWTAGKFYADANDKALQTSEDARFYQISAKFDKDFSNEGKDLILQYSVKHEQNIDCGGGYIKILPAGFDQKNFNGDTNYNIMFGPDICGSSTRKTHLIFNYKGTNHLVKKEIRTETDEFSHLYTLILHPNNEYEVLIDGKEVQKGNLKDDFDLLPPQQIKDPKQSKPSDWVDEKMIADPADTKPAGWDDIPAEIPDPEAKKPEDWDDELDGEWEAPTIDNPEFKGEWSPKMIENPAYKGEWVHPMIANPDYVDDPNLYRYTSNAGVGIEVWQVKAGTLFDKILVTDDAEVAKKAQEAFEKTKEDEKKAYDAQQEEKRKQEEEERKKREAEEAAKHDDDEEEEEDDHKDEL